jgi:hypothetical protein
VAARLTGDLERQVKTIDPNHLTPMEVVRWAEVFIRIEREALGLAGATTRQTIVTPPGQPFQVEQAPPDVDRVASILEVLAEAGVIILPDGGAEHPDYGTGEETEAGGCPPRPH